MDEPTINALNIHRARIFQLINKALVSDPSQFKSYAFIADLDRQLLQVIEELPWYFRLEDDRKAKFFPLAYDFLTWQNHILRTCVSTHRVRMYRPFLADQNTDAFNNCIAAVEDALTVYRSIRSHKPMKLQQKFYAQAYQIFLVAVTLAALLLVERTIPNAAQFRVDIQTMADDLGVLEIQACPVPVAVNGRNILLKMISLFEQGDSCSPEDAERLVPDISIILGGERTTRAYLGRRTAEEPQSSAARDHMSTATAHTEASQDIQSQDNADTPSQFDEHALDFGQTIELSDTWFGLDDLQLTDSYGLFSWDMTGLLSDAVGGDRG